MQFKQIIGLLFLASLASAQTNIAIGTTAIQTGVKRLGVNLGGFVNYDSGQILKNLTAGNPGFMPTMFHSTVQCGANSTASSCVDANLYAGWPSGFWPPFAVYIQVISGAASGCTPTLNSYIAGTSGSTGGTYTFSSACNGTIAAGDYMFVEKTITPTSAGYVPTWAYAPTTAGNGTLTTQSADLPPGTTSTQALTMTAPAAADSASISASFDANANGRSFVNLNGTFQIAFAAKGLSGTQQVSVSFRRGGTYYLSPTTITLTPAWANYTVNFTASETGSQPATANLGFSTVGADSFYIDNITTTQLGTSSANPSVFRDAVVTALQTLKPGVIRMWDGVGLGNTLDNMLVDQFGRSPVNYSAYSFNGAGYYNGITYSIPEFLQLVQTVGNSAEAWIVVPITMTPAEASNLIDYLSGGSGTVYGAKRIAQGFTKTWTSVIPKIHLEFGNEAWNSTFDGGNIKQSGVYAARAQTIFAAMKANSNYDSTHTSLVLGSFFTVPGTVQYTQNNCNNNDEIDVAPYMMNNPTDASSTTAIWQPALTEPQAFYANGTTYSGVSAEYIGGTLQPSQGYFSVPNGAAASNQLGGGMFLNLLAEANSNHPVPVAIYEENFSTTGGSYTQAQLNAYASAWGAGLVSIEEMMLGMKAGVLTQNLFSLTQYQFKRPDGSYVNLWGSLVDMGGPTNLKRPQFLSEQVANSAITPGATMLQTIQSGTNPTYNQSILNTVAMNGANNILSFAYDNGGGSKSIVLLNVGVTGSQAVTFSGANAPPSGSAVTQTVLTSANLSDTNESSNVIAPVTTVLNSFNPSTGITLAPYSETVLTWGGTNVTPTGTISFSPASLTFGATNVGSSSATQTIVLTNSTASSLAIFSVATTGPNFKDFTLTNTCGTQLAASASCNIVVTFTPSAAGTRTATVSVADSATGSPQTAALVGTAANGVVATYYVSNSGSDSNSGTSSSSPWQTVAKVNAQTLTPGATVLFQAGGLWREELIAATSGTAANPITYGSYGAGPQPIIDAANLATWTNVSGNIWSTPATNSPLFPNFGGTPGVQESSQAALTAANEWYWDGSSTLYVYSATNPAATVEIPTRSYALYSNAGVNYITVQNLELRGAQAYGLQCYAATSGCSNWILNGNTVDLNYSNGAYILTSTAGNQSTNGSAQKNILKNNGSSGFKIGGYWASWNITGNQIYSNCLQLGSGSENTFCGGIYVYSASGSDGTGSTISQNTVYNNGLASQANANYGQGIWTDTTNGVSIVNNVAYGNESNGIYLEKTVNGVAYRNIGYANGGVTYTGCLTLAAGQGHNSTGNLIYQNTCSGGYWTFGLNFEDSNGSMSNNTIQNNIFTNSSKVVVYGAAQVNNSTNGSGNVLNHNSFGLAYSNFTCWGSACQSTYSAFESAYGGTTNSLQQAPGFINPSGNNFNLKAKSAARGFGAAYSGYPALCGTAPDIGALPYPCGLASPAGGQTTLTSPVPITWSLSGPGSLSTTSGTSTIYTAPSGVFAQNQMLGCPVLPNDSIFNTPINTLPTDPNSAAKIASMNSAGISFAPSWGISYADSTTPAKTFLTYVGEQSLSVPYPTGSNLKRENGAYLGVFNNALNHHIMTVQRASCQFYESFNDYLSGTTQTCQDGVTAGCNVQGAQTYPSAGYTQTTGTVDAAGLLLAPLVYHLDEIKSGAIKHAVRFSMGGEQFAGFVWPASTSTGGSGACSSTACVNQGDRLRLTASFNISTFSSTAQIILTALQTYGMIQADNGTPNALQTATDVAEDPTVFAALQEIKAANIAPANFEVVDESMLQLSASSYQVCPYTQTCGFGAYSNAANTYVTPLNQAIVTGGASSTPIAIQAVAIGTSLPPEFPVTAGSYTLNLGASAWVNPASVAQTIAWSETSSTCSGDSITSAGIYTPPSSVTAECSTTLHGVASADSAAAINIYLTVIPSVSSSVRIDSGASSSTTDNNGNVWQSDTGAEGAWLENVSDSPNWSTASPLRTIYQSDVYNYGNDIRYDAIGLPNGRYKVHLLYGFLRNGGCTEPCATWPGASFGVSQWSPQSIEVNGVIMQQHFNWGYQTGYLYQAPADAYVEALVTNNILEIGSLLFAPDSGPGYTGPNFGSAGIKYNSLNGIEIVPDTATASGIAIDLGVPSLNNCAGVTAQNNQICAATSNQPMNAIPILLSGFNSAATTWKVLSDPTGLCSLAVANGAATLTMAAGTPAAGQPIVIKATNGSYSATATVYSIGSRYMLSLR